MALRVHISSRARIGQPSCLPSTEGELVTALLACCLCWLLHLQTLLTDYFLLFLLTGDVVLLVHVQRIFARSSFISENSICSSILRNSWSDQSRRVSAIEEIRYSETVIFRTFPRMLVNWTTGFLCYIFSLCRLSWLLSVQSLNERQSSCWEMIPNGDVGVRFWLPEDRGLMS